MASSLARRKVPRESGFVSSSAAVPRSFSTATLPIARRIAVSTPAWPRFFRNWLTASAARWRRDRDLELVSRPRPSPAPVCSGQAGEPMPRAVEDHGAPLRASVACATARAAPCAASRPDRSLPRGLPVRAPSARPAAGRRPRAWVAAVRRRAAPRRARPPSPAADVRHRAASETATRSPPVPLLDVRHERRVPQAGHSRPTASACPSLGLEPIRQGVRTARAARSSARSSPIVRGPGSRRDRKRARRR